VNVTFVDDLENVQMVHFNVTGQVVKAKYAVSFFLFFFLFLKQILHSVFSDKIK